ncbi:MAG: hypothetical protein WCG87_01760 [Bacteroidota bacterium]
MILSETWFIEGYIDFELQKYRLLAYLKEVSSCFSETKLYPQLADVIFHYNNLVSFRNNKKFLKDQFPKKLGAVDMQQLELLYEQMLADDDLMEELEHITEYAVTKMKGTIDNGAEIYEIVERQLHIEPVGIIPLYKNEGYMLIRYEQLAEIRAYYYAITLFEHQNAQYRGIKVQYIDRWMKNIINTYEQIKKELVQGYPILPNPAVFSVESSLNIPLDETLLPIAKRVLVKQIAVAA